MAIQSEACYNYILFHTASPRKHKRLRGKGSLPCPVNPFNYQGSTRAIDLVRNRILQENPFKIHCLWSLMHVQRSPNFG